MVLAEEFVHVSISRTIKLAHQSSREQILGLTGVADRCFKYVLHPPLLIALQYTDCGGVCDFRDKRLRTFLIPRGMADWALQEYEWPEQY